MNKGKFVLGTVLGAAAGVVAGMLTAPKSGEETRADLKARAAELKEEAARRAADMNSESKGVLDTLMDKVESVTDIGKKPTDEVKKDTSDKK
jgi:gas vesicle protein